MKPSSQFKPNIENLKEYLSQVSRERNPLTSLDSLHEVERYLKEKFLLWGFEVLEDRFSYAGQTFSNLIVRLDPDSKNPRVIVGAHFDAVPGSPGADDNASGVAALLEAARIYASLSGRGQANVEFVAFNLEEYGMVGSQAYARRLKREKVPVLGMLSLEMIGYTSQEKGSQKMPFFLKPFYPEAGNFIGLVADTKSKPLLEKVKKIFQSVEGLPVESLILPANGWVFPDARLSDHSPFWDEGFPALLVTDTSFYRNPYYHSDGDRIETLDLDFLAKVTEATVRTAWGLSGLSTPDPDEGIDHETDKKKGQHRSKGLAIDEKDQK